MGHPKQIEAWTYDEILADPNYKAQGEVESWLREAATNGEWWDYTYETWTSALADIGITDVEIQFSGFSCQGDGASFTAKSIDTEKLIRFMGTVLTPEDCIKGAAGEGATEDFKPWLCFHTRFTGDPNWLALLPWAGSIEAHIRRDSHQYSHEHTCKFEADVCDYGTDEEPTEALQSLFEEWCAEVEDFRLSVCRAIYKHLEEEHEDITSDENLKKLAEANEWEFDCYGRPV